MDNKYFKKVLIQFLKFVAFSCGAGIIQFGVSTLLFRFTSMHYWLAYLIGLILSVIYNYTLNGLFTFKIKKKIWLVALLVLGYYAVFTPASLLWGAWLTDGNVLELFTVKHAGWNEILVLAITMLINMITEFAYSKYVVFGTKTKIEESEEGTQTVTNE